MKSMAGESLSSSIVGTFGILGDRGWALRDERTREITSGKRIPLLMHCAASYRSEPHDETIPQVEITLPDGSRVASDDADVDQRLTDALERQLTLWARQQATNKAHYRRKMAEARVFGPLMPIAAFRALLPIITKLPRINRKLRAEFSREVGEPIPDISNLPTEVLEFTSPPGTYFDAFPIHLLTTSSLAAMQQKTPQAAWDRRRFRPNLLIETVQGIAGLVESEWPGKILRIGQAELNCEISTVRCGMTTYSQKDLPEDSSVLRSIVKDAGQNLGIYANVRTPGLVSVSDVVHLFDRFG